MIKRDSSMLLVVDIQVRLAPAIDNAEGVVANAAKLLDVAAALDVPVLATEQYPRGLGPTVAALAPRIPDGATLAKEHFCSTSDPGCAARLARLARRQVVLAGMEAHICVLQTALGLKTAATSRSSSPTRSRRARPPTAAPRSTARATKASPSPPPRWWSMSGWSGPTPTRSAKCCR